MGTIFTSNNAVIVLDSVGDIWLHIICWTMACVGSFFFAAGIMAGKSVAANKGGIVAILVPLLAALLGVAVGMAEGGLSSLLIAAIYNSVPYEVGIDTAAGIGIGQGLLMVYFHLGRADFVHR